MQTGNQVVEQPSAVLAGSHVPLVFAYVDDEAASRAFYEQTLGFRPVPGGPLGPAYDAGQVMLCLVPAREHGVVLAKPHDDSTDLVFLVDDIEATSAALERRGTVFERRRTYEIGSVIDFYDANGHRLMLYEPSPHALETPAGDKIRALWRTKGIGSGRLIGPPAVSVEDPVELTRLGFHGKPLIYLFHFIKEIPPSMGFMEDVLGLEAMHRTPCCNSGCPDEQNAVVKYEAGGLLLSTHHMHGHEAVLDDHGNPYGARDFRPEDATGLAPVFSIPDLDAATAELSRRGATPRTLVDRPDFGRVATVEAPSGHAIHLYEPAALDGAFGERLREIAGFSG
jgi:predicted enzyme related to lactoylglutathione lyase